MPEFKGRLRTPRLSGAPASPITGEMYYDTTTNKLLWWNGTVWVDATGQFAPAAHASTHKAGGSDPIRLDELALPAAAVNFNGYQAYGLIDPVYPDNAANKGYTDNKIAGVPAKATCRVASIANVLIPGPVTSYSIDGVALANNDRVLVKNQTNSAQNGIYVFQTGIGLLRADDMDSVEEFLGAIVWVSEGSTNADTGWVCTNDRSMVLDTTGVTFIQFASAAAGAYAYVNLTGAAIVPTQNAWTAIGAASGTWAETLESDAALFNPATGIFTCKQAGIYAVSVTAGFANNTTGARGAGIYKNGSLYTGDIVSAGTGTNSGGARTFGIISLAVGDTIQAGFYVNGATPNVTGASIIIYSLNGIQGPKGDPGGTEYAMRGVGSNFSATGSTWVRPVMGSPTDQSANATDCLRFNADGTITILKSGWYSFGCEYQITGLAAQNGVQFGFWETSDDTVPASPGTNYKQEIPYPNVGTPVISGHWTAYLPVGYRIGLGVFNRGATATFTLNRWSIARLGAGPQGIQGIQGVKGDPGYTEYGARIYNTAAQSIPNSGTTVLTFNTERYDTSGFWSAGAPTRFTIPADGVYLVGGHFEFAPTASGGTTRQAFLRVNGATIIATESSPPVFSATNQSRRHVSTIWQFVAGDYVELCAWHDQGAAINVNSTTQHSPEFWIARIGAGPQGTPGVGTVPIVAVLPTSPVDGDMVMYQNAAMAAAGVLWHLRYSAALNAQDGYGWVYVGGSPLQHEINVSESPASAGAWVNLTTDGPKVTCPLKGIYNCMWGAQIHLSVRNIVGMCGIAIGDTTPTAAYINENSPDPNAAYVAGAVRANNAVRKRMTVAAGDVLKLRYQGTVATAQNSFDNRWLDVTPMRVG